MKTAAKEDALSRAIRDHHPVTLVYTREDGTETMRTVEPYDTAVSRAGDQLLRAMDRDSGEPRTWRLDRITWYQVHSRGRFLVHVEQVAS